MLTLAFDSSSKTVSVALLEKKNIIYEQHLNTGLNHSEVILPAIDKALKKNNLKIKDIDLFACTVGPGSFTGVRLAVSTIKGMMLATSKPAVGVSTLASLALNVSNTEKLICVVMDAGRGQVYTANFCYDKKGILQQTTKEIVIKPQILLADSDEEIICVGEGVIKYEDVILKHKKKNIIIDKRITPYIKAAAVGILGIEKYERRELLNVDTCIPVYLRSADARPSTSIYL